MKRAGGLMLLAATALGAGVIIGPSGADAAPTTAPAVSWMTVAASHSFAVGRPAADPAVSAVIPGVPTSIAMRITNVSRHLVTLDVSIVSVDLVGTEADAAGYLQPDTNLLNLKIGQSMVVAVGVRTGPTAAAGLARAALRLVAAADPNSPREQVDVPVSLQIAGEAGPRFTITDAALAAGGGGEVVRLKVANDGGDAPASTGTITVDGFGGPVTFSVPATSGHSQTTIDAPFPRAAPRGVKCVVSVVVDYGHGDSTSWSGTVTAGDHRGISESAAPPLGPKASAATPASAPAPVTTSPGPLPTAPAATLPEATTGASTALPDWVVQVGAPVALIALALLLLRRRPRPTALTRSPIGGPGDPLEHVLVALTALTDEVLRQRSGLATRPDTSAPTAPAQAALAQTALAQTAPASTAPASTAPAPTAPAPTAPAPTAPAPTAPAPTAPAPTAPAPATHLVDSVPRSRQAPTRQAPTRQAAPRSAPNRHAAPVPVSRWNRRRPIAPIFAEQREQREQPQER